MNQPPASQPPPPPPGGIGYRQFGGGAGTGGPSPVEPEGGAPYGPLQRRLLGIVGLLAVLMIALVVFHALHTGSTGLNAVAEAAERTARQPGGRLAMEVTYTIEGAPGQTAPKSVIANGGGVYNARTDRTRATLTVPVPGRTPVTIESVGDERRVFMRSPMFAGELPQGKEWLGMEPLLGHSAQTAFGSSGGAKSQLELLKAVGGGVDKLDQQTVRGHLTTRYKGSVELGKAAQLLAEDGETALAQEYEEFAEKMPAPIPVEVWIDEHGLARQVRLIEQLPTTPGGPTVTTDVRMQFYAFGAQPKIKLPPSHKVLDLTPVLRAELGLEDGSTLGPLTPATGTKPLPAAAFHKRVIGICKKVTGEARTFFKSRAGEIEQMKAIGSSASSPEEKRAAIAVSGPFYEGAARLMRSGTKELAAISPPASLAADYQRYLLLNAKQAEWTLAEARASEVGPTALLALKTRAAEAKTEEAEQNRLEKSLGVSGCGKSASGGSSGAAGTSV